MKVIVDNLAVNYELKGKGKVVLLLHGWADNHQTFSRLISYLSSKYAVVALDLPGFGESETPRQAWNLDNYDDFIASFLTKLSIENIYAIIGHSNGGALAIRGLSRGVLKADKLVLLASAGVRNSQPLKRVITKSVAKAGKVTTFWLPKSTRQSLRSKLYGTVGSDMLVVPELSKTFKLTVAQDVQADAAKLKLPTLIINADNDPAIPAKDGERFHYLIKHSKLKMLNGNDHFIHHQYANTINQEISEFLSQ